MADLYYYESGYIDTGYHVYTADAVVDLTVYIEEGYIDADYYLNPNVSSGWSAAATITTGITHEGAAALSSTVTLTVNAGRLLEGDCDVGALFTPSITAIGYKNHTASFDSTVSFTATVVVNRAATITLENLINQSAQAVKTVDAISYHTVLATQSTTARATSSASSALTTESTLSATATLAEFGQASLAVASSIYASKYLGTGRPRNITVATSYNFSSATKKFGTHSLQVQDNNGIRTSNDSVGGLIPSSGQSWAAEIWFYPRSNDSGDREIYTIGTNRLTNRWLTMYVNNTTVTVETYNTSEANLHSLTGTVTFNSWNHLLVVKNSSRISLFVNGTRSATSTSNLSASYYRPTVGLSIGDIWTNSEPFYDDASFHVGTTLGFDPASTTITVPTSQRVNDSTTTRVLLHFNNDLLDDIYETVDAVVTESATTALSAQANPNTKSALADLAVTATESATATVSRDFDSDLSSEFTQTTAGIRVRFADSTQSATVDQSTVIGSIKQFTVTVDSLFTSSMDADLTARPLVYLESTSTVTAAAVKTTDTDSDLSSEFTQITSIKYTAGGDTDVSSEFAQSTQGVRVRSFDSTQSATADITAIASRQQPAEADLAVTASFTAAVTKLKIAESALSSEFAQSTSAVKTTDTGSTQSSEFTQTADNVRVRFADSTQSSEFTQTTSAVKTASAISTQSAEATQTTSAVKTAVFTANNMVLFGSSIDADLTARPLVYLESTTALTAIIGSIKQFEAEKPIIGIQFDDSLIVVDHHSAEATPRIEDTFLIAFWANDPQGYVLETVANFITQSTNIGYIKFDSGDIIFEGVPTTTGYAGSIDYKRLTWTSDTNGWHHYIFYQSTQVSAGDQTTQTNVKLYIDGELQSAPTITLGNDGQDPTTYQDVIGVYTPFEDFLGRRLEWYIGGAGGSLLHNYNGLELGIRSPWEPYQGGLGQFVTYWTTVPDMTDNTVRAKLYSGYQDLGTDGTLTGLAQPQIYIPMENYRTVQQAGSLPLNSVLWRDLGTLTDIPDDNIDWYDTEAHTASINDNYDLGWLAQSELTARFVGVFLFVWNVAAEFAQSATVTRILAGSAALSTDSAMSITAVKTASGSSSNSAEFTESTVISKITGYSADLSTEFTETVIAGFFERAQADLTDDFDLIADVALIPPTRGEAQLSAEFTVTITASSYTDAESLHLGDFTVTAEATLIPPIRTSANLSVDSTLSVIIGEIEQGAALIQSSGTVTASGGRIRPGQSTLSAEATESANIRKIVGVTVNITALHSVLTAGDVINIDPFLTLTIAQETRSLKIKPESRTLNIEQETRRLIIEGWE